jgi:acetolactate synthase-1/3 small subunit
MKHTISVLVENKFGVLARITGLFSGRGFNIDTLNVGPMHDARYSRITATLNGDESALDQAIKQLSRLINVIEVSDFPAESTVGRELILMKVKSDSTNRTELTQLCDIFRAKIVSVNSESLIIEVTGNDNKIKAFLELIQPFGILEMARTGNVALSRN